MHPSRRQLIALGVGAFVVAAAPFLRRRGARLVRRTVPVMGTIAELGVVHDDAVAGHAAIDAAIAELRRVEWMMSRYSPTSDVGRANRLAARDAVDVSPATVAVLEAAIAWAIASDGVFDPCIGRAVELWDVEHRTAPPPTGDVRRLAGRRLYRALDLDGGTRPRVRLTDRDAAIDLGGIAKGYAVDRAADALRHRGIARGIVNVGGDLYAIGRSEDGDPWRVGIRSAADPDTLTGALDVADAAVATSGDYERFFEYRGHRYHHLLDPETAAPRVAAAHSVTIRAASCLAADAAATAVFGLGRADAARVLRAAGRRAELI
ncbi:MAG TPA: FAD:protein FMN transferase [Gemmatimonadales bacterium]|nr:FAD:protein FMN transferase [Gemmatimonadales bacterium]